MIYVLVQCSHNNDRTSYSQKHGKNQEKTDTTQMRLAAQTGAATWNSLPPDVTSTRSTSSLLSTFKSKLKTYLFSLSFPDLVTVK